MDLLPLVISLLFLLLMLAALWLAWRMRLKRRQVQALQAQHAAMLDRQRAALHGLREKEAQGLAGSPTEQQGSSPRPGTNE